MTDDGENNYYQQIYAELAKEVGDKAVKYMGTREGVERVAEGIDNSPATVRQQRLVQDIIKFDSSVKDYGEYHDYESSPTKSNAS
ncbi:hypothetical protein D5272_12130 [bacterium D16-76]|nr:hypothetical protein [bacterium D16-76]